MSEGLVTSIRPTPQNRSELTTAGSLLRAAREREGLHVAALAVAMKVPVKKLEALEADRLDLLPDVVFVRALAASVCRALKTDPAPVLALLPVSVPSKLRPEGRGTSTPFDAPRQLNSMSLKDTFAKPTGVVVMLLLASALGVYFFPESPENSGSVEIKSDAGELTHQFPDPMRSVLAPLQPAAMDPSKVNLKTDSTEAGQSSLVLQGQMVGANSLVNPAPAASGAVASKSDSIALPSDALVSFKADGAAWIQVTDGKGLQLISRTLTPGEVVKVSGLLPLAVIVGRSDLTTVEVRGKSFDLSSYTQNNVARFEVKP